LTIKGSQCRNNALSNGLCHVHLNKCGKRISIASTPQTHPPSYLSPPPPPSYKPPLPPRQNIQRAERILKQQAEKTLRQRAERQVKQRAEKTLRQRAERQVKQRAEKALRQRAERQVKQQAEKALRQRAERQVKQRAEKDLRQRAERQAKQDVGLFKWQDIENELSPEFKNQIIAHVDWLKTSKQMDEERNREYQQEQAKKNPQQVNEKQRRKEAENKLKQDAMKEKVQQNEIKALQYVKQHPIQTKPFGSKEWSSIHSLYRSPYTIPDEKYIRYAWTRRPIVRLENYKFVSASQLNQKPEAGKLYLPVVRYDQFAYEETFQQELRKQKFESDWCGKFFFYEPNSTILMDLGRVGIYATKVAAAQALMSKEEFDMFTHRIDQYMGLLMNERIQSTYNRYKKDLSSTRIPERSKKFIIDWINRLNFVTTHQLINSLRELPYTPTYYHPEMIPYIDPQLLDSVGEVNYVSALPRVLSNILNDEYDNVICMGARRMGLDTVILQHEEGEAQTNTEVLSVDQNPYRRLIRLTQSPDQMTTIETDTKLSFSPRLNQRILPTPPKEMPDQIKEFITSRWFPNVWFLEDGLYFGSDLKRVKPVVDPISGEVKGLS
jgi:hypothetical protein